MSHSWLISFLHRWGSCGVSHDGHVPCPYVLSGNRYIGNRPCTKIQILNT